MFKLFPVKTTKIDEEQLCLTPIMMNNEITFLFSEIEVGLGYSSSLSDQVTGSPAFQENLDYVKLEGKQLKELKALMSRNGSNPIGYISANASCVYLMKESCLYTLLVRSDKPICLKFKNWVTREVLPEIRRTGQYKYHSFSELEDHKYRPVQIQNSKDVNDFNFGDNRNVKKVIQYNTDTCVSLTGKYPAQIIKEGKQAGLKSKDTTSAKEVLRHTQPEIACTMSFIDNMVKNGGNKEKVVDVAKNHMISAYKAILDSGLYIPGELNQ